MHNLTGVYFFSTGMFVSPSMSSVWQLSDLSSLSLLNPYTHYQHLTHAPQLNEKHTYITTACHQQ